MNKNTNIKFAMSSWPSSGGTTMALICADILDLPYIYAGGVLKEWSRRMGYDPTTNREHQWEQQYGTIWDIFWEEYILLKVKNSPKILAEGKTLGFLLPKGLAFEVMITASLEVRSKRANTDLRSEFIQNRDNFLQRRWLELFKIDLFNLDSIKKNYDLLVDNSNLNIYESLELVFSHFLKTEMASNAGYTSEDFSPELLEKYQKEFMAAQAHGNKGKDLIKARLQEKKLIISNEEIFKEWNRDYPELLTNLPPEMRAAIA